jgi:Ni/Co efflux regulator RcnB
MNNNINKSIISAAIAVMLTVSTSVAFAQHRDNDRNDNGRGQQSQDHKRPDHNNYRDNGRNDRQNYQARNNDQRDQRYSGRGAGPRHDMRRGGRISNEYRGNQYVVNDWRGHHLSAPPRGSHWVQTGSDYVLVAVATGIIAQILLAN